MNTEGIDVESLRMTYRVMRVLYNPIEVNATRDSVLPHDFIGLVLRTLSFNRIKGLE